MRRWSTAADLLLLVAVLLGPVPGLVLAGEGESIASVTIDARVLSETATMVIDRDGSSVYSFKRRVRIMNENGSDYGTMRVYESRFVSLIDAAGRVYDAEGKLIVKRSKKDLERYCGFGEYSLFADVCDYWMQLGAGNFPFTVEFEYRLRLSSLFFWPGWQPQADIPVDTSTYILDIPDNLEYRMRSQGGIGEPSVRQENKRTIYDWTMLDLPAFERDPYMPPEVLFQPGLEFSASEFDFDKFAIRTADWAAISRSMDGMMAGAFTLSNEQRQTMAEIIAGGVVNRATLRRLHELLTSRSRYVAVSIGIGGWQPHTSSSTFAHGYGDCKDLATMYASMLRQAGVDAVPALVLTKDRGRTEPGFPGMDFNHMILLYVLDRDTVWIDPTCFTCRPGDLPWPDEDIYVLAVDAEGGAIVRTPASRASDNEVVRKAAIQLQEDMSVTMKLDIRLSGNAANVLRSLAPSLPALELAEELKGYPQIVSGNFQISECNVDMTGTGLSEVALGVTGRIARYARVVNDKCYFDLSVLPVLGSGDLVDLKNREYPIEFKYPYSLLDTVTITIPPGWHVSSIPSDTTASGEFGSLEAIAAMKGDQIVAVRSRTQDRYGIDTTEFDSFANYIGTVRRLTKRSLVVEKR
jgi:hypothetical protein